MDNDFIVFLIGTGLVWLFAILLAASIIVPAADLDREEGQNHE